MGNSFGINEVSQEHVNLESNLKFKFQYERSTVESLKFDVVLTDPKQYSCSVD